MGRNARCLFLVMCLLVSEIFAQDEDDGIRKFDFDQESMNTPVQKPNTTNEGYTCEMKDGSSGRFLSEENCEDVLGSGDRFLTDESGKLVCCGNYSTYMVEKVCERLAKKNRNVRVQTLGGNHVELGDFPHVVAIGYQTGLNLEIQFQCSGTLISDLFVLVAAQCIINKTGVQPYLVRLGTADLRGSFDTKHTDYLVDRSIAYPGFHRIKKQNDIGLLRLARKVERFSETMHPACLDWGLEDPQTTMTLVGFDLIGMTMKKSNMLTVSHKKCEAKYASTLFARNNPNGLPPTQMCASKDPNYNGTFPCEGSIGALHIPVENTSSLHTVVGLQSYGQSCSKGAPDIFTRVSKYLPWITKTVWPEGETSFADDF